ncbi:rRNA processing/ribosome biogenesis-domain-containing protein [Collybia nuda]|uniref:Pre-rRNA-processing protein RIX1 n=1 Tax=Collybia nuda TaxID=64659 RepID=A0A9P5Y8R7_9AGAR|nr:rRNA processing/ribosome biogenesis-domain-containing protein [Collybia nuda]
MNRRMDTAIHPLKILLQLQLATDSSAVVHLPYIFSSLTSDYFSPNPHLSKWTTRINSLLYSKDPGGRWAGLCIALKTSELSRDIMVEFAQIWLGVALPMLSRSEPKPTTKAAIRLLAILFSASSGLPEFQRQVATPNIPKFTTALIALIDKNVDEELKILILETLALLIPIYPTPHRASYSALSSLSFRFLNGGALIPTSEALLKAASRLYSVLPYTGGKVAAVTLWRKEMDETLAFGWSAFFALRTTFPEEGKNLSQQPTVGEPQVAITLGVDRLQSCIVIISDLLSSTTHRPVQLPLGSLVQFAITLLSCSTDNFRIEHYDPSTRAMEISVIPKIWKLSCDLISCIARSAHNHLTPNLTRLVSCLTFHLEQNRTVSQRLFLLTTLRSLLTHCHPLDSLLIPTRLARAVLPSLFIILDTPTELEGRSSVTKSKKGKRRARDYEGDEVFNLSRSVICPSLDDGKVILVALEVMQFLMRNNNLSSAVHSISSRVLISVLLALPQISPTLLSIDPSLHKRLIQLVRTMSIEFSSGTTSEMSKSLSLVIHASANDGGHDSDLRNLDILLHPRVPPLVRALPHVESLSLFRVEASQEETEALRTLGLQTAACPDQSTLWAGDVTMENGTSAPVLQPRTLS